MRLSEYLAREGLSHQAFADRIGVSQAAISRYASGTRFPEPDKLVRIKEATGGLVTAEDFLPPPHSNGEAA